MKFGNTVSTFQNTLLAEKPSQKQLARSIIPFNRLKKTLHKPQAHDDADGVVPDAHHNAADGKPDAYGTPDAVFLCEVECAARHAVSAVTHEARALLREYMHISIGLRARTWHIAMRTVLGRTRADRRMTARLERLCHRADVCLAAARINTEALRKLLKKHDRHRKCTMGRLLLNKLHERVGNESASLRTPLLLEVWAVGQLARSALVPRRRATCTSSSSQEGGSSAGQQEHSVHSARSAPEPMMPSQCDGSDDDHAQQGGHGTCTHAAVALSQVSSTHLVASAECALMEDSDHEHEHDRGSMAASLSPHSEGSMLHAAGQESDHNHVSAPHSVESMQEEAAEHSSEDDGSGHDKSSGEDEEDSSNGKEHGCTHSMHSGREHVQQKVGAEEQEAGVARTCWPVADVSGMIDVSSLGFDVQNLECPICMDTIHKPIGLGCGHTLCMSCLQHCMRVPTYEKSSRTAFLARHMHSCNMCPMCRQKGCLVTARPMRALGLLVTLRLPGKSKQRAEEVQRQAHEERKQAAMQRSHAARAAHTSLPSQDGVMGHRPFHPMMLINTR